MTTHPTPTTAERLAALTDEERAKVEHLAQCGPVQGWLRYLICRRGHRL